MSQIIQSIARLEDSGDYRIDVPKYHRIRYLSTERNTSSNLRVWLMVDPLSEEVKAAEEKELTSLRIRVKKLGDSCGDVAFWPLIGSLRGKLDPDNVEHVFGEPI